MNFYNIKNNSNFAWLLNQLKGKKKVFGVKVASVSFSSLFPCTDARNCSHPSRPNAVTRSVPSSGGCVPSEPSLAPFTFLDVSGVAAACSQADPHLPTVAG